MSCFAIITRTRARHFHKSKNGTYIEIKTCGLKMLFASGMYRRLCVRVGIKSCVCLRVCVFACEGMQAAAVHACEEILVWKCVWSEMHPFHVSVCRDPCLPGRVCVL